MGRWLNRLQEPEKNLETAIPPTDRTDETPPELVSSVLSVPPGAVSEIFRAIPRTSATAGDTTLGTGAQSDFEERAAIVEEGARVPREWAEGFVRLDLAHPPRGFTERRWRQLIDDGGRFLDQWAGDAAKAGWIATDVFGVHPLAPNANYSLSGLVLLISGGEVVRLSASHATIRTKGGSELSYIRREMPGSIAVWELSVPESVRSPRRVAVPAGSNRRT